MIASLNWGNDPFQTHVIAISGSEQVASILQGMVDDNQNSDFLELLFCVGGCINVPDGAFKKEELSHSSLQMTVGDRLVVFSDGVTQGGWVRHYPLDGVLVGCASMPSSR
ncbi:MAG: [Fe-Fe] hydrogenase large subunit C-terminal domain-containing protein [Sphaerochaeta sp.]